MKSPIFFKHGSNFEIVSFKCWTFKILKKWFRFIYTLTSIVQDREKNIQPAWNEGSDSVGDWIERIEGSSSNSSELNDSEDQEMDSQQEQEAEEMIAESSTSRYDEKGHESSAKTMCHLIIYIFITIAANLAIWLANLPW